MSSAKLIGYERMGEYGVALLEQDDKRFFRARTANPYGTNYEHVDVFTAPVEWLEKGMEWLTISIYPT